MSPPFCRPQLCLLPLYSLFRCSRHPDEVMYSEVCQQHLAGHLSFVDLMLYFVLPKFGIATNALMPLLEHVCS